MTPPVLSGWRERAGDFRTPTLRAVDTALRVLAALASGSGDWSVSELAEHLGIAPSHVYKVLATLSTHGFAEQDPGTRRYRVGWSILLMGMKSVDLLLFGLVLVAVLRFAPAGIVPWAGTIRARLASAGKLMGKEA